MRMLTVAFAMIAAFGMGCGEDSESNSATGGQAGSGGAAGSDGEGDAGADGLPEGCDHYVMPSDDDNETLQTALIEAESGSTVCLGAGTYSFRTEVSASVDDLTIRGAGATETVLDFGMQDVGGNGLLLSGDNITVEDFKVLNPPGDGIRANDVDGVTFRRIHVIWDNDEDTNNGAYGLYPVGSTRVLIESCVVKGASDAGIYVGQSNTILVKDNEAYGNVAGIEVENSTDAEVVDNHAHDNTAGILVFNLPELAIKDGQRTKVHRNLVENNNLENFGKPGSVVGNVPGGTGLMILSTDNNEATENIFRNNGSSAIILVSYLEDILGLYEDDEFDPYPNNNYIHNNIYEENGRMPQSIVAAIGANPGPDILFDGCEPEMPGPINCINEDESVTYRDVDYCNGFDNENTDRSAYDCELESLPGQMF